MNISKLVLITLVVSVIILISIVAGAKQYSTDFIHRSKTPLHIEYSDAISNITTV